MNLFKVWFTGLGLIYVALFTWAAIQGFGGSMLISGSGLLICVFGWSISHKYLDN